MDALVDGEEFRLLSEAAFDGLFLMERGNVVYVNDAGANMLGYEPAELVGRPIVDLTAPASRELVAHNISSGYAEPYEVTALRKDGSTLVIEVRGKSLTWRGRSLRVGAVRDLTERRRAEASLHASEARFRTLIEQAPEPIGVIREGRFVYLNARAVEVLGYAPEELVGRPVSDVIHPDDHAVFHARIRRRADGEVMAPHEYRGVHRDGSQVFIEVSAVALELDGLPSVVGFVRDVTERRQLETRMAIADRLSTMGLLAAGVAHEINNPLSYVLIRLAQLAAKLPRALASSEQGGELLAAVADVRTGADRIAAIVRDLRTFAHGQENMLGGGADPAFAIESAVRMARHEIDKCARLETELALVPLVRGTTSQLGQVVLNLLVNAVQAIPAGHPETQTIRVATHTRDQTVVIEVSDTGTGIPPDVLPRIFDPFFTTKPPGVGTGLGLSICHGLVTAVGGTLGVTSAPGRGSTFTITLPVA